MSYNYSHPEIIFSCWIFNLFELIISVSGCAQYSKNKAYKHSKIVVFAKNLRLKLQRLKSRYLFRHFESLGKFTSWIFYVLNAITVWQKTWFSKPFSLTNFKILLNNLLISDLADAELLQDFCIHKNLDIQENFKGKINYQSLLIAIAIKYNEFNN